MSMGIATLPFVLWTPFIGETAFHGWVAAFDLSLVALLATSGPVMHNLVRRRTSRPEAQAAAVPLTDVAGRGA